jgi:hypothetical protein
MSAESPANSHITSPVLYACRANSPSPSSRDHKIHDDIHKMANVIIAHAGTAMPLSPRSAGGVLENPDALHLATTTAIAKGLLATCKKQNREYAQDTTEYQCQIQNLKHEVAYLRHDIQLGIRSPAGTPKCAPVGYLANNGQHPGLVVPVGGGVYIPAKWVKHLDDRHVAMLGSDFQAEDEPYITDIYSAPAPAHMRPYETMPPWFRQLLSGPGPLFEQLRAEAADLDNWGILADIVRYRKYDNELGGLYTELNRVQNAFDTAKFTRGLAQSQLKTAQAHKCLDYLEGHIAGHPLSCPHGAWKKRCTEEALAERGLSA